MMLFRSLLKNARPVMVQQRRWAATYEFGDALEKVHHRSDFPQAKLEKVLGHHTLAVLGYGTQGRAQALNLRDNNMNVIVGLREGGRSWNLALEDGFIPGKTLFPLEQAAEKGSVVMYLLSDAGQKEFWPTLKPYLTEGKTLYFSHGFSLVYNQDTGVKVPPGVDVVLVAPKGSGTTVRRLFLEGRGINSSVAVYQGDERTEEMAYALGVAVGSGYMFETTFRKEVYSDLTGERGVLMGAIHGLFLAQYKVLRENGHTPSEAFNETVEEATQSLYPLIGENGMDWMYANCSTTAQRGALDWFPKFRDATEPVFRELYENVVNGNEARRSLEMNGRADYHEKLEEELKAIRDMEIWRAGVVVRSLRPERAKNAPKTAEKNAF